MGTPALLLVGALLAQTPQPSLRQVVERFDAAQARAENMQAPFTLTIQRTMLRTPTVTKGTMYVKGSDFVHFTFAPPEDLVLHLTPKSLVSINPRTLEGEQLKIGAFRNADRKFLGLGQKLSYLTDYFQMELSDPREVAGSHHLALTPRSLSMRKRFQMVHIWVDRETYLPRQIQWIERGGDTWVLELGPITTTQALPAAVLGFRVPAEAKLNEGFSFFATSSRKK
jgi:outer membrane lipoprotein-sorting protein